MGLNVGFLTLAAESCQAASGQLRSFQTGCSSVPPAATPLEREPLTAQTAAAALALCLELPSRNNDIGVLSFILSGAPTKSGSFEQGQDAVIPII